MRAKRPDPAADAVRWRIVSFQAVRFKRLDGRSLLVQVMEDIDDDDGEYGVLALEAATGADPQAILNNHGHKILGKFATETAAKRVGEAFGRRWMRSGLSVEACGCDDIQVPKRSKRRDAGAMRA